MLHRIHSARPAEHVEQCMVHCLQHSSLRYLQIDTRRQSRSNSLLQQASVWQVVDAHQKRRCAASSTQRTCQNEPHQT